MAKKTYKKRRNRNRSWDHQETRQDAWAVGSKLTAFIIILGVLAVSYIVLTHSGKSLETQINLEKDRQAQLMSDINAQQTKWNAMKTPRALSRALARNGISMSAPLARTQVVHIPASSIRLGSGASEFQGASSYAVNR